jgi:hypothetical protein
MSTDRGTSELVNRRRAAAAARAQAAEGRALIDENPDPVEVPDEPVDVTASASAATVRAESKRSTPLPLARRGEDLSRKIDRSDVVMPQLKLSQAMSKVNQDDAVRQGNWYISTSGRNLGPEVYIVPLDMQKARSKFVQGKGVVCRSYDMLRGIGDPGILCEGTLEERDEKPENERGCPDRLWTEDPTTGKRRPPKCGISANYPVLVLDPDDPHNGKATPALLPLRSTAYKMAKKINTIVTEDAGIDSPIWHEVIIKLGVEKQSNTMGTFFVPTVSYFDETSGPLAAKAEDYARSLNPNAVQTSLDRDDTE